MWHGVHHIHVECPNPNAKFCSVMEVGRLIFVNEHVLHVLHKVMHNIVHTGLAWTNLRSLTGQNDQILSYQAACICKECFICVHAMCMCILSVYP